MAAPNLPLSEAITWDITVDDTYTPSKQGVVVNQGDQITFYNNSGVDITIEFQPNVSNGQNQTPVYAPMSLPVSDGDDNSFTAPRANCAANYYIYNADVTPPALLSGPFVIQVGSGPMYVSIAGSISNPTYSPQTVAVPLGTILPPGLGKLQMNSNVPNTVFGIGWTNNNDPFDPAISSTGSAPHPVDPSASVTSYSYAAGANPINNPTGGKVIIQN